MQDLRATHSEEALTKKMDQGGEFLGCCDWRESQGTMLTGRDGSPKQVKVDQELLAAPWRRGERAGRSQGCNKEGVSVIPPRSVAGMTQNMSPPAERTSWSRFLKQTKECN